MKEKSLNVHFILRVTNDWPWNLLFVQLQYPPKTSVSTGPQNPVSLNSKVQPASVSFNFLAAVSDTANPTGRGSTRIAVRLEPDGLVAKSQ